MDEDDTYETKYDDQERRESYLEYEHEENDEDNPFVWEELTDVELARLSALLVDQTMTDRMKRLSHAGRNTERLMHPQYVYEELTFHVLNDIFIKIRKHEGLIKRGGTFVDLGSGTGRQVLLAALLHPFETCLGIERIDTLHSAALELQNKFDKAVRPLLPPEYQEVKVEFRRRDFLQVLPGLAETDVWLAHSTLFDDEVMDSIAAAAEQLRIGSFVITCTKRLPSYTFKVLEETEYEIRGIPITAIVQQKVL